MTTAKARLPHGGWAEWLDRLGLKARTASTWMRLATMGLTAEEVIDRGGINAALKGCKSATVADLSPSRSDLQRELEDTERQIQETKAAYYAALTARHRALRALTLEPWKLLFSYEIALSCSRLPHHLPLCLYLHLSYISYCCAESIHTLPYSIKFFCRLWRLRMPSRHDEKGGDGMSISASSVTLAAWSSSSVKSDAGGSGSGCSAFGLPVGSTASEWTERWARRR